jgi:hypothetical protein
MKTVLMSLTMALALGVASSAQAGMRGTLTLDGLSFLAFEGERSFPIPAGSTITFRFGDPASDGSVGFAIQPDDVAIAPIEVGEGTTLRYALDAPTQGTMRSEGGQRRVEFTAVLRASLASPDGTSASTYSLHDGIRPGQRRRARGDRGGRRNACRRGPELRAARRRNDESGRCGDRAGRGGLWGAQRVVRFDS